MANQRGARCRTAAGNGCPLSEPSKPPDTFLYGVSLGSGCLRNRLFLLNGLTWYLARRMDVPEDAPTATGMGTCSKRFLLYVTDSL